MQIKHIKQSGETSCGAAALAMIYQYLGLTEETESKIFERLSVVRPSVEGEYFIKSIDLAKDGEKFGFSYFIAQADLTNVESAFQPIKEFLDLGIPVIVCQQISASNSLGHFRVVRGINSEGNIEIEDPLENQGEIMNSQNFMRLWQDAKNDEVIGGQFIAIFKKSQIKEDSAFKVTSFHSSINSFKVTSLEFI